jgi:DNA polymerase elongation subunit (family B)
MDDKVVHVYYEDGKRREEEIEFKPILGKSVRSPDPNKTYEYHDIYGNPLQWKRFDSIPKYRNFIDEYEEVDFFGTMKEDYQFLSERYPGAIEYNLSQIRPYLIDIEIDSSEGFANVEDADKEITSISLKDQRGNRYFVMATKPWEAVKTCLKDSAGPWIDLDRVKFYHCKDEETIFKTLRKIIRKEKPDMLVGFYAKMFDFPYIIKRGRYVMGKQYMNGFSPFGFTTCRKKVDKFTGKVIDFFSKIEGIPLLDFQLMYKKFVYTPREMYSLDYLSEQELGDAKLDYSEYDTLHDMWEKDPQKYIDYNIWDVELIDLLDQKLGLINLTCTIAFYAKTNFVDTLGTVGVWDSIFFNTLKEKKVMIPAKHVSEKEDYAGAYVYEPDKEIHEWLIAVDLKSLYPHVQQQYNISPESLLSDKRMELGIDIEEDLDDRFLNREIAAPSNAIMAANGCYFRKDKEGIVPGLLREIYDNRVVAKKEMIEWKQKLQAWKEKNGIETKVEFEDYDGPAELVEQWAELERHISTKNNFQMAMKILMNSEYGALANVHFRYYDVRLASAITLSAQLALKWAAKKVMEHPMRKKYRWELLYGDTDSLYLSVKYVVDQIRLRKPDISDKDLIKQVNGFVAKVIQPILNDGYDELAEYVNANENRMFMNHEKTITNALWTSKKRYALNVLWDEGVTYDKPKLKVKGIEIVRSSTPKVIRDALKESVAIMLEDESKLLDFVKEQKDKFKTHDVLNIAFPRSANNIDKFLVEKADGSYGYASKTPIGVRAAIIYNNHIKDLDGWPEIQSGEKIKYVYLTKPNIFDENVIGFIRRIPEDAIKYVDWDMQFEKTFLSVIQNIYRKMGKVFKMHKETNLMDIF